MRKIIGNKISIFFNTSVDNIPDLVGLLVDVTEDEIYLRDISEINKLYVVPRGNIKYCTTDVFPSSERAIKQDQIVLQEREQLKQQEIVEHLDVFINEKLVSSIPVPPTFDLSNWHDDIMKIVMGSPDVRSALVGQIQRSIEYIPGKVYILSDSDDYVDGQKPFIMGSGDVSGKFLNPSQMIDRLNKVVKRRKNNDENKE